MIKKNKKKYLGNLINNKYDGRGILYNNERNIEYNGYFKDGIFDGFGKKYKDSRLEYKGFFKNGEFNGRGILYNGTKKKYEGYFKNGKYDGIGIEYLPNETKRRKANYEDGHILEKTYGVLYNGYDKKIYEGLLFKGKPQEAKNIIFYEDNENIYIGDFSSFQYNGKGTLFIKNQKVFEDSFKNDKFFFENNRKYFEGIFENGKGVEGKLFDPEGKIAYEGEVKDYFLKQGKNIKLYDFNGYLFYEGDFLNYKYEGNGKLYKKEKNIEYEGEFKSGLFEGKGILYKNKIKKYEGEFKNGLYNYGKLYKLDDNDNIYLYYQGNFKNNKIYGKGIKYYYNGNIKIEGIFDNINSYEGLYYNPENKIIFERKMTNEIPFNYNNNIVFYNDKGLKVYESENYNEENKLKITNFKKFNKNNENSRVIKVFLVSSGPIPGKTCLLSIDYLMELIKKNRCQLWELIIDILIMNIIKLIIN